MKPETVLEALGFKEGDFHEWREQKRLPKGYTSFLRFLFEQRAKMTEEQLKHFDKVYITVNGNPMFPCKIGAGKVWPKWSDGKSPFCS